MTGDLLKNMTGFKDYIIFPNLVTDGWFWTIVVLLIFFISFISFLRSNSMKSSAIASLFIATVISLILSFVGVIQIFLFTELLLILSFAGILFYDYLS